jgi:hypothetical protein
LLDEVEESRWRRAGGAVAGEGTTRNRGYGGQVKHEKRDGKGREERRKRHLWSVNGRRREAREGRRSGGEDQGTTCTLTPFLLVSEGKGGLV